MPSIDDLAPDYHEDIEQQQLDDELRLHEALYPNGKPRPSTASERREARDEMFAYELYRNPPPDESR